MIGTSLDKGEELDALAKLPPERQERVIARAKAGGKVSVKTEVKQARREEREKELAAKTEAASRALGRKLYGVSRRSALALRALFARNRDGSCGRQSLPHRGARSYLPD